MSRSNENEWKLDAAAAAADEAAPQFAEEALFCVRSSPETLPALPFHDEPLDVDFMWWHMEPFDMCNAEFTQTHCLSSWFRSIRPLS